MREQVFVIIGRHFIVTFGVAVILLPLTTGTRCNVKREYGQSDWTIQIKVRSDKPPRGKTNNVVFDQV